MGLPRFRWDPVDGTADRSITLVSPALVTVQDVDWQHVTSSLVTPTGYSKATAYDAYARGRLVIERVQAGASAAIYARLRSMLQHWRRGGLVDVLFDSTKNASSTLAASEATNQTVLTVASGTTFGNLTDGDELILTDADDPTLLEHLVFDSRSGNDITVKAGLTRTFASGSRLAWYRNLDNCQLISSSWTPKGRTHIDRFEAEFRTVNV